jgi:hypothetical protein
MPQTDKRVGVKKKRWVVCFEQTILGLDLSIYEKMVYIVLCSHAKRDGSAFPSVMTIADEASCSSKVFEALNTLEEQGIITRESRIFPKRGQSSNLYEIEDIEPRPQGGGGGTGSGDSTPPSVIRTPASAARTAVVRHTDAQLDVFEQDHLNRVIEQKDTPLTPQGADTEIPQIEHIEPEPQDPGSRSKEPDPMTQRGKEEKPKPGTRSDLEPPGLIEAILAAYNRILPELPKAEKVTASRAKALRRRIRESPERKEPGWWEKFFSSVRGFPWPMGQNRDRWRADFDWLIGERGMQKILEGAFLPFQGTSAFGRTTDDWRELEEKYTTAEGFVDAKAILRDIDAAERQRRPIGIVGAAGNHGNTGETGFSHSRGNPG